MVGKKPQNEPESPTFDPYLHLTSVSPDLESGPEKKEEGTLIIWMLFTNRVYYTAVFTVQFTVVALSGATVT